MHADHWRNVPRIDGPLKTTGSVRATRSITFQPRSRGRGAEHHRQGRGSARSMFGRRKNAGRARWLLHHGNIEGAYRALTRRTEAIREARPPFEDDKIYYCGPVRRGGGGGDVGAGQGGGHRRESRLRGNLPTYGSTDARATFKRQARSSGNAAIPTSRLKTRRWGR